MSSPLEGFRKESAVLERVAQQYGVDSAEGQVLRRAGLALLFAALDHKQEFDQFLRDADTDASAEGAAYLSRLRAKRRTRQSRK